jgi:hypothetical protein
MCTSHGSHMCTSHDQLKGKCDHAPFIHQNCIISRHFKTRSGTELRPVVVWFADQCPFTSPLLSSPAFLTLLSPMVTYLNLANIPLLICPDQFAAICDLTNLEELDISGVGFDEADRVCSISDYCVKAHCCILCSNLLAEFALLYAPFQVTV